MSPQLFNSILEQVGKYLFRIQFYYYGEPFVNKNLLEMIKAASTRNIGTSVSTNFSFSFSESFYREIVESGLEHLIVSLDGTSAETYEKYRVNGRFELVMNGMREVIKWKKLLNKRYPVIEWQFIVFEHNKHQVEEAKKLALSIGVDRFWLRYDGNSDPSFWEPKDRLADHVKRGLKLNSCLWLWGAMVIDWNGIVKSCCLEF